MLGVCSLSFKRTPDSLGGFFILKIFKSLFYNTLWIIVWVFGAAGIPFASLIFRVFLILCIF
jgi:hypothetical protein